MNVVSCALLMLLAMPALGAMELKARQTVDVYGSPTLEPGLAEAEYRIAWQLDGEQHQDGCVPSRVQVSLTATVTEPLEWPQTPQWQNYRLALTAHERLMRERALMAAEWLEHSLLDIAPQADCIQLHRVADNIGYHQLGIAQDLLNAFQRQHGFGPHLGLIRPAE
ncbi:DUF922 domain-containing protein [Oceanimonas marisflavi]|uniref:DUF922 domain-containing protein n=1 Tax=Oceanimonas marisflavi TaxID=2059724 RepID=UPI001E4592B5|nr:DUF922 domain-containing protein [Oceanimonas marisflavi]